MKTVEQIFEAAKAGSLRAGHLIPNHADSGKKLENRTPIDNSLIGYIADGLTENGYIGLAVGIVSLAVFMVVLSSRVTSAEQ